METVSAWKRPPGAKAECPPDARIDRAVVDRLAHYMAAVSVAAAHANEALDSTWKFQDALEAVRSEIVAAIAGSFRFASLWPWWPSAAGSNGRSD